MGCSFTLVYQHKIASVWLKGILLVRSSKWFWMSTEAQSTLGLTKWFLMSAEAHLLESSLCVGDSPLMPLGSFGWLIRQAP